MNLESIKSITEGLPFTGPQKGTILYNTVLENRYENCLELGFAHGTSSIYIAGALHEINNGGVLTCIDNLSAHDRVPNIYNLLKKTELSEFIDPVFSELGYNWYLRNLTRKAEYTADFVFIDGSHSWDVDGFAFLLIANMISSGGLLIFDDLDWTYAESPSLKDTEKVRLMPNDYKNTPQVREVFELLVQRDDRFDCWEKDGWGYARRI